MTSNRFNVSESFTRSVIKTRSSKRVPETKATVMIRLPAGGGRFPWLGISSPPASSRLESRTQHHYPPSPDDHRSCNDALFFLPAAPPVLSEDGMQEAAAATIDRLGLVACYETRSFWPFWVPFCWVSLAVRCGRKKAFTSTMTDRHFLPTLFPPMDSHFHF